MSFSALDYLAHQMYVQSCQARGQIGPHWWCLAQNIRAEWRAKAKQAVEQWSNEEHDAARRRGRWQS